jgi:hypothetical protein
LESKADTAFLKADIWPAFIQVKSSKVSISFHCAWIIESVLKQIRERQLLDTNDTSRVWLVQNLHLRNSTSL